MATTLVRKSFSSSSKNRRMQHQQQMHQNDKSQSNSMEYLEKDKKSIFAALQDEEPSMSNPRAEERLQIRAKHLNESGKEDEAKEAPLSTLEDYQRSGGNSRRRNPGDKRRRKRISEVPIAEVLRAKHSLRWVEPVIPKHSTVREAVLVAIERGLSGMMVIDDEDDNKKENNLGGTDEYDSNISNSRTDSGTDSDQRRSSDDGVSGGVRGRVVGMITSRDLLRILASGFKEQDRSASTSSSSAISLSADDILSRHVVDYMTPITQVIYARPEETVGVARTVMAKLGVKCLPVLSHGRSVEGLVTARDLSEFGLEAMDKGGKKHFLRDVSERVGLGENTSMAEPPAYLRAHLALGQRPLYVNVGVAELPHPFKGNGGSGRAFDRANGLCTDVNLSEDSHFMLRVSLSDEQASSSSSSSANVTASGVGIPVMYCGVADGVGSWREYGVDPGLFSRRLMEECRNILVESAAASSSKFAGHEYQNNSSDNFTSSMNELATISTAIAPAELLALAHTRVQSAKIIGSSTACVALFDSVRHQLHFSNLGDSGIIVLRHIDSDIAGSLKRDRLKKREDRKSDLRVAFVSQQQLLSFNHPYQLGYNGINPEEEGKEKEKRGVIKASTSTLSSTGSSASFKTASEACTSSIHVRRGDIIIMATDGLFDNIDIDDIAQMALDWERESGFLRGGDGVLATREREKRWMRGVSMTSLSAEVIPNLAEQLCHEARIKSLDSKVDSPFAILAKENDIMWSGGMPDDCTVIAMHVVGKDADAMEVEQGGLLMGRDAEAL